jgi:ribosomal protein S18 acetylase RimI-like enzyme
MKVRLGEVSEREPAFEVVCKLFDDYRAHYGQDRSLSTVRVWLGELTSSGRLRVLAGMIDGLPRGFVTTTTSPASLTLGTALLIRDLWVDPGYRRLGLARHLLTEVIRTGRAAGARRIALQTEADNLPALALYEELGFQGITGLELLGLDLVGQ